MEAFIIDGIERGGYLGIAFLMVIENIFPPIPSEVIMGLGGALVARGKMEFWPLLIAGTLGSTAGNYAWFWVGDRWGYERLRPFITRWGRWLTLEWEDVEALVAFFLRRGEWVVFLLRFSPFMRTMISLPAGLSHMGVWKFLIFTMAGAAIWNIVLILGGSFLDTYLAGWLGWIAIGTLVVAVAGYLWRMITWKPRRER